MTDETRTREAHGAEGRTPSDFTDDRGQAPEPPRPDFLPAEEAVPSHGEQPRNDGWSQLGGPPGQGRWGQAPQGGAEQPRPDDRGGQPGPVAHPGQSGWGDPSGRARQDTAVFGPPAGPPPPPSQAFGMGPGWAPPPGGYAGAGYAGAAAPGRRGPRTSTLVVLAVVIALLASTLGSVGTYLLTRPSLSDRDPSFTLGKAPTGSNSRPPESIAGVAARVLPSVVSLAVDGGTSASTGSGFLIKGGYVVTNNHVVAAAAPGGEIQIQFSNRKSTSARIIGRDPESDLAVVKPEETFGAPEISLGNSDNVVVGDPVVAIGSPLGLVGTVTSGIVSSLNRPVQAGEENSSDTTWLSAIQTDAAINPGNSGGPLVNANGEVIGVNSAIATLGRSAGGQSGSIGLGFAIPVNHARRIAEELVSTGVAKKSRIGITIDQTYQGAGVRIDSEVKQGTRPVEPDGPADKAGLKPGDVILEINGTVVQDSTELIALIRNKAPGEKLVIKFQRGGQEKTATVTVGAAAAQPTPAPRPS
ncbi:S1C family serine protease [Streptosporangium roseum]|uniref:Trypsin-like protein serine protease typically periplasmic containing C-terminal PDZ domain-like protein n=1 Tax=Streptosporangium roseum (strain ATCC 12428 / DSM 43021 / JCM 3005 / KCTC 9067 / NCIMB 10171 / NRRL 2505 / NI 9100) TaxID=479432 RepID=D2B0P6_STRRD|nr:trypsin-like peptidase domain-containing protein [Streptosporangium roseum]ACZ91058.1 Trypsin-like protein serine protease typically periplasmic containing C-terminal PDZ domain-like protein [Streptosporangium roseum DSM 43021]